MKKLYSVSVFRRDRSLAYEETYTAISKAMREAKKKTCTAYPHVEITGVGDGKLDGVDIACLDLDEHGNFKITMAPYSTTEEN